MSVDTPNDLTIFNAALEITEPRERQAYIDRACGADAALRRQTTRQSMNNKFDELTKGMAQSVTRRAALTKFGFGLAGMALACLGLANKAAAQTACLPNGLYCTNDNDCCS